MFSKALQKVINLILKTFCFNSQTICIDFHFIFIDGIYICFIYSSYQSQCFPSQNVPKPQSKNLLTKFRAKMIILMM